NVADGRGLEGTVAIAQQHANRSRRHHEVEAAVAIEVSHHHGNGIDPDIAEVASVLEGAVAVAQQHAHAATVRIGHGEVEAAVAVEVPNRHGTRLPSDVEVARVPEGAVAVT